MEFDNPKVYGDTSITDGLVYINKKTKIFSRKAESVYIQQEHLDIRDLSKETGCEKPCKYKKYRRGGKPEYVPADSNTTRVFGIYAVTNYTLVSKILYLR